MIKAHPMKDVILADGSNGAFLQFALTVNIDGELQTILGWGHPQLINLVKNGKVHLFVDCTFKVVPKGFTQCMILMIYHPGTEMYVPIFYVLLQSKKTHAYYHALQQCICASDWKLEAMTYTSDFEQAIMSQLKFQFPEGVGIFCLFHFKQALGRKLKEFGIPKGLINALIGPEGVMNMLTEIPISEMEKGIEYCRWKTDSIDHLAKLNSFWKYFRSTWLVRYRPEDWNVESYRNEDTLLTLINRTNNPLERFNRKMNQAFPNAHPSMNDFVDTIKKISCDYRYQLSRIDCGSMKKPVHAPATVYPIPADYATFNAEEY